MSVVVTHNAGFFSCCSVRLDEIAKFINQHKKIPAVDSSRQFEWYKDKPGDITYDYFRHYEKCDDIELTKVDFCHNYQFTDYSKLDYTSLVLLVNKFFSISDEIKGKVSFMENNKYNIEL